MLRTKRQAESLIEDGIFGVLDDKPSKVPSARHPVTELRLTPHQKVSLTPKLPKRQEKKQKPELLSLNPTTIDRQNLMLPDVKIKEKELVNAVRVRPSTLKRIEDSINTQSKALSRILLTRSTASMLALDKAEKFAQSVLKGALGQDTEADYTSQDIMGDIGRLDISLYLISQMNASEALRNRLAESLVDRYAEILASHSASASKSIRIKRAAEAMGSVYMASEASKKQKVQTSPETNLDQEDHQQHTSKLGARRSRR